MAAVRILVFFVFISVVAAEPITFKPCPGIVTKCTVTAVRVTPCAEAVLDRPCKIKRGHNVRLEFDYITDFVASNVSSRAYWAYSEELDVPIFKIDTDSCKFTTCPIEKNKQLSFNQTLPIWRFYPMATYLIKWRMIAGEGNECCVMGRVKLIRDTS